MITFWGQTTWPYWMAPEIYLSIVIIILITYGVLNENFSLGTLGATTGTQSGIKNIRRLTWLSIIGLINTLIIVYELSQGSGLIKDHLGGAGGVYGALEGWGAEGLLIKSLVLLGTIGILLISLDYYNKNIYSRHEPLTISALGVGKPEYITLILLSVLGMLTLISAKDLIALYLSIELLSLSLYILAGIKRTSQYSTEASLRYFMLGALSSGLLLFGSTLVAITAGGHTEFTEIAIKVSEGPNGLITIGFLLIMVAILFKLAAAPFHMWAPDVYEGAPTIITAFFAIVPKIATLSIFITLIFGPFFPLFDSYIQPILLFCATLSVIVGSIGAINQTKIKRLFAYSAIGHMGFLLLGLAIGTYSSIVATLIYFILYIIMGFQSFTFLLTVSSPSGLLEQNYIRGTLASLCGLSRTQPVLAISFAFCLLSLAGIPPLAGFFSKYLVLLAAISNHFYAISTLIILFSAISCFYYIRIIQFMYFKESSFADFIYKDLISVALFNPSLSGPASGRSLDPYIGSRPGLYVPDINRSIILGLSLFLILTILFYPNPLLMFTFDVLTNALI